MKIIITNRIYLYHCTNPAIRKNLIDYLTIVNPKHTEAVQSGRRTYNIPKTVSMFNQHDESCFSIPRGAENFLNKILDKYDPNAEFDDRTYLEEPGIEFKCKITPWDQQIPAIEAGLSTEVNVISLPTGGGKTVCALYMIYKRKQPTLILVHTKELMYQWQSRIKQFLNYDCGLAGDNQFKIKSITVGIKQTIINRSKGDNFAKSFGYLIVDECHKVPSSTFTDACDLFESYYITGLTATPSRRDKMQNFIFFALGDLVYKLDKSKMISKGKILKPTIIKRNTNLQFGNNEEQTTYVELLSKLKNSEERNQMIVTDIQKQLKQNYACCLVLSDHSTHLKKIEGLLNFFNIKYHLLTGKAKNRKQTVSELFSGKVQLLLATNSLIGEGFDYSGFTDLFFISPIGSNERLEQILGRGIRTEQGKTNVNIIDYVDKDSVFQGQWNRRNKFYQTY